MKAIKTHGFEVREKVDQVIKKYYISVLQDFLANDIFAFDSKIRSNLIESPGVYCILRKSKNGSYETIYIGMSKNLRDRLYSRLLMGDAGTHTLRKKLVKNNVCENDKDVKEYLRNNCCCQFIKIEIERERILFEHFAISILRSIYND